jgi:hypothetical protein
VESGGIIYAVSGDRHDMPLPSQTFDYRKFLEGFGAREYSRPGSTLVKGNTVELGEFSAGGPPHHG